MWAYRPRSDGEARAAAAGCLGLWIVDPERGADQVLNIIDLCAVHILQGNFIDQHNGAAAANFHVVGRPLTIDVEFILKSRAAAALDADAQCAAGRFVLEDLADSTRRPLGYGDVLRHVCLRACCNAGGLIVM